MSQLIGITGAIGSGKTSFAAALAKVEPSYAIYETFQLVAEIGDAFNQALKAELAFATARNDIELINQALIWLPDTIQDRLKREVAWGKLAIKRHSTLVHPTLYRQLLIYVRQARKQPKILDKPITEVNKQTYRSLVHWLTNYLVVKVGKTIWYDELLRRVKAKDSKKKLVIICGLRHPIDADVIRNAGGRVVRIRRPGGLLPKIPKVADPAEVRRRLIKADCIVFNNGKPKDLISLAKTMWQDLSKNGGLKTRYSSANSHR